MWSKLSAPLINGIPIPDDLLQDILSRLPAKSLMRFMCAHRSWYALIKNPDFIRMHFNRSVAKNNDVLAILCDHPYGLERFICLVSDKTYKVSRVISTPCEITFDYFRFVDCCNGVICLSVGFSGSRNYLLNPAIKEIKKLPKPDNMARPNRQTSPLIGVGFGFDPTTNDYKMVRIYDSFQDQTSLKLYSKVDLYTLSTDCWRSMENVVDGVIADDSFKAVKVNDLLHWKAVKVIEREELGFIMSFDVVNEVFGDTMLPNFHNDRRQNYWHPFVFNDSLSAVVSNGGERNRSFDIWVMNEYGVVESWSRQLTIDPQLGIERVISCGKNDELLLQDKKSKLAVYDPRLQETKRLKFQGRLWPVEVVPYAESIVMFRGKKFTKRKYAFEFFCLFCCLLFAFLCSKFT